MSHEPVRDAVPSDSALRHTRNAALRYARPTRR